MVLNLPMHPIQQLLNRLNKMYAMNSQDMYFSNCSVRFINRVLNDGTPVVVLSIGLTNAELSDG